MSSLDVDRAPGVTVAGVAASEKFEPGGTRTMARGVISLGAVPARERFTPGGEVGDAHRALAECRRYVELLRDAIGPEPHGAELQIRRAAPERGSYLEVVVEYDDQNNVARAYAIRCDREGPTTWA